MKPYKYFKNSLKARKMTVEQEGKYVFQDNISTRFMFDKEQKIFLGQLCGLYCGLEGSNDIPEAIKDLFNIRTNVNSLSAASFSLTERRIEANSVQLAYIHKNNMIGINSLWEYCKQTGIWSRKDNVRNISSEDMYLIRYLYRYVFTPDDYEIFSQQGAWCNENQGVWQDIHHGSIILKNEGGRTTQGGTPYMCLKSKCTGKAVAFNVIPCGNWVIKVISHTADGYSRPFLIVEIGLSDENLNLYLAQGESIELPEVLIQPIPNGKIENSAPYLHRYLLKKHFDSAKPIAPVIYNTWFDAFDFLEVGRLRKQLQAARQIGCEVFVIDSGWYGSGNNPWFQKAGDWSENSESAFNGKMRNFAQEVRKNGLGFGLWMEPERNFADVPIVKSNPDWFLKGTGNYYYPNLVNEQAYKYVLSEISRLIETYELVWMKIDYNFKFGIDPSGTEFAFYYNKWYMLLDELRARYPGVFFEGCASGGMRLDINTLGHFDSHFLSDNANPSDVIRIYQQAILRLLPGRLGKWVVLRSAGCSIPQYGIPINDSPARFVTPAGCGAIWEKSETVDVDFAVRAALCGMPGFSGDISSLPNETKLRLNYHVQFYKKWREFIAGAVAFLLTPVEPKTDHTGWIAIQLKNPQKKESLVFVYRLEDPSSRNTFNLRELESKTKYSVSVDYKTLTDKDLFAGTELMNNGFVVELPDKNSAAICIVQPEG